MVSLYLINMEVESWEAFFCVPLCQGRKCYECDYFLLLWYELRCGKVSHLKHIHSKQVRAMNLSHIEHLGIAVKSIEESLPYYEGVLGLKCYNIEEVADQKVKTAFLRVGQTKIELLEATSPDSTIAKFIEKRGEGIHHIAFAVPNTDEALQEVSEKGVQLIDKHSRKGAEGLNIGFLHPKSTLGVLTELCDNRDVK